MVYVALLRGINVGGKNRVEMGRLKETFLQAGMDSVTTYINSGNVVFTDRRHQEKELAPILEKAILEAFGLDIRVLVRSLEAYEAMMKMLPESWKNDETMKSDVLFLWDEVDKASLPESFVAMPGIDTVILAPGAILWSVAKKDVTRSGLMKIAGTALYRQVTVRNVNSARKIHEIMKETGSLPNT